MLLELGVVKNAVASEEKQLRTQELWAGMILRRDVAA